MSTFLRSVWEFVVGDDPAVALGVAVALAVTALFAVWWILPVAVAALLAASLWRGLS